MRLERTVTFPEGIEARDAGTTLSADWGTYNLATEVLRVRGNIVYTEAARVIQADRATYDRSSGFIEAWGNVFMEDQGQGSVLRAGEITYDNTRGFGIARWSRWFAI